MSGAVRRIRLVDAEPDHHVEMLGEELFDHLQGAGCVIGGVAIDQHIDVGIDVGEHAPHHVALALVNLAAHLGARPAGNRDGAVFGIVVVNVDGSGRERLAEISDNGRHRRLLVVARHQHGNARIRRRHCHAAFESTLSMKRLYRNQALAGRAAAGLSAAASLGVRVANRSVHNDSMAIGTV
jgi:hypothetical protein